MNTDKTKLRDKRLMDETAEKPATKPNQRNTKYSQHFTPEAVKPDNKTASTSATQTPENNRRSNSKLKFSPEEKSEIKAEKDKTKSKKKQIKLQHDADTVSEKLEKARSKVDKRSAKNQHPSNGKFGQQIKMAGAAAIHRKIGEAENENVGTQSAHSGEYAAERLYGAGKSAGRSAYRFARESPMRKAAKLENKSMRANIRLDFHKAVNGNPKLKSNALSRYMQKRRIKKQYAKAAREAKRGYQNAKKTVAATRKTTQAVVKLASNPKVWIFLIILLLVFFLISACMSSFSFLMGSSNHVLASTYLADEEDITGAELLYTGWETDLQLRVDNAERDRPGYDEYRYNIGHIGHDPFEFMAYLTAVYQDFNVGDITSALQSLFNSQYQISFAETVEIRFRTENYTVIGSDGETRTETRQVPYNWRILTVTLTSRSLTNVVSMNDEQTAVFTLNMASKGNRQFYGNPIGWSWLNLVSSRFGYRIHPINGTKDYHKGIDMSLPVGTNIHAVHDGTVITVDNTPDGYGRYIVIENNEGMRSLYAHLDAFLVSEGQGVNQGDIIAKSGNTGLSTGPHLHLETLKNRQYLNPIYFLEIGG